MARKDPRQPVTPSLPAPKGRGKARGGAAASADDAAGGSGRLARLKQIRQVFTLTRQRDPKMLWWTLLSLAVPIGIGVVLGFVLKPLWIWIPFGVIFGVLIAMNVFGRRAQRSAYKEMEGQPGAGAAIVQRMRGDFRVTTPVQVNRNQDLVSRVVSRAGVILIAEGRGRGPRDLLGAEVRRVKKVIGDAPLHDIIVGNGEGEVPLTKLQNTIMRKRRVLRRGEVDELYRKLSAIGGMNVPLPKGPMPTRVPRGGKMR
jgi:hypothetical protein